MKTTLSSFALICAVVVLVAVSSTLFAQSSDQNFPTPVTTNEIRGTIRARDIGDSRATTYFYAFNGEQGDIFVNVQTRNFDGDIDVFTLDGVRPLTKIVLYADAGVTETGRIVYLRKGERLLLRIEGRSPDDNPATFSIKFAGSFIALKPSRRTDDPGSTQTVSSDGVRRNATGAIIPASEAKKPPTRPETTKKDTVNSSPPKSDPSGTARTVTKPKDTTRKSDTAARTDVRAGRTTETAANGDPLTSIRLIIVLRDGKRIVKQMTDVLKFSLDKTGYTLIFKDGNIIRYQVANVLKVSIE